MQSFLLDAAVFQRFRRRAAADEAPHCRGWTVQRVGLSEVTFMVTWAMTNLVVDRCDVDVFYQVVCTKWLYWNKEDSILVMGIAD